MTAPVVLVVAAGPGVSGSVARLLAADGYRVGLLGVDAQAVDELATSISDDHDVVRRAVVDRTHVPGLTPALSQIGPA